MKKEFLVPEQNLSKLRQKLEKLFRRADKTNLPYPFVDFGIALNEKIKAPNGQQQIIRYRKLIVSWGPITHSGWEVSGKLQHLPEGNLVRSFGEQEIPHLYRNAEPDCNHCQVRRRRLTTYIISNKNEFKQVGDDCLQDYLKVNTTNIINAVKLLTSIIDTVQASEALPAIGTTPDMWPLDIFLAHVADSIRERGWIARKTARAEGGVATADSAYCKLTTQEGYQAPSEESVKRAQLAIEWAEQIPEGSSDFLHNLHIIALSGAVEHRSLGYAASIIPTFDRDQVIEETRDSKFVGVVGDRSEFKLTVQKIVDIESQYGEQFIHIMKDSNNNVFVWRTKDRLDENRTYSLKARIKAHQKFNETNQTHLFYCKLLENAV